MPEFRPNTLYYGDNLTVLRDFPPECVDLIYLDPPFNSNRSYNVLFKEDTGREAEAQVQAFEDTWHWGQANSATHETYTAAVSKGDDVGRMLEAFVGALGHNDVTAYLTMMASRLVALRRVLKPTGSIYLHCDPTAGHYLKVLMDAVFGAVNFKNEIVWKRTSAHSDAKQGAKHFGRIHDLILVYARSEHAKWTVQYGPYEGSYTDAFYKYVESGTGRKYRLGDLTAAKPGGDTEYEWEGPDGRKVKPYESRYWAYSRANMREFERQGRLVYSRSGMPQYKRFLDEMPGMPLQDVWSDIGPIGRSKEYQGYATQKPEALLARIIQASSDPGDLVLDPFCGCGTAVVAAHRLERKWVGMDIAMVAVNVMRNRLQTTFPDDFPDEIPADGEPADEAAALDLASRDKYEFQYWVVDKLGGTPRGGENRKGPDRGIDGVVRFPEHDPNGQPSTKTRRRPGRGATGGTEPAYRDVIISVKGGQTGPAHVRDLHGVVEREKDAVMGVLVIIRPPTSEMLKEAAEAGVYMSPWTGKTYPKIQILTAGEIVHGRRIDMPPKRGLTQYQAAPRAKRGNQLTIREMPAAYTPGSGDSALPEPDSDSQDDEA